MNQTPALKISSLENTSGEGKKINILHVVIYLLTALESLTKGSQTVLINETKKSSLQFCSGLHDFTRKTLSKLGPFSWAECPSPQANSHRSYSTPSLLTGWQQLTWGHLSHPSDMCTTTMSEPPPSPKTLHSASPSLTWSLAAASTPEVFPFLPWRCWEQISWSHRPCVKPS